VLQRHKQPKTNEEATPDTARGVMSQKIGKFGTLTEIFLERSLAGKGDNQQGRPMRRALKKDLTTQVFWEAVSPDR
jgi:hypothetical protein